MSVFEALYLMFTFGTFIFALLTYIESRSKRK